MEGEENRVPPGESELQLRRCLDARTRRWAAAEFFYSAIDRPWFMRNQLCVRAFHFFVLNSPPDCPSMWVFACTLVKTANHVGR